MAEQTCQTCKHGGTGPLTPPKGHLFCNDILVDEEKHQRVPGPNYGEVKRLDAVEDCWKPKDE